MGHGYSLLQYIYLHYGQLARSNNATEILIEGNYPIRITSTELVAIVHHHLSICHKIQVILIIQANLDAVYTNFVN